MGFSTSYMVLLLLVASSAVVLCRPQDSESTSFSDFQPSQRFGTVIGEIQVFSHHVDVKNKPKKKRTTTTTPQPDDNGPLFLKFIRGPVPEATIPARDGNSLAVASGPALSISGPAITFNKPAEVVPISA